jgi:hypothetical protein
LDTSSGESLSNPKSGRRSLKKYEVTNLLFFLVLIVALGVLVTFVFRFYGTRNVGPEEEGDAGVVSDSVSPGSDVGMFYLGTKLAETTHQYRSRLEVPVTDDGLLKEIFDLPGVEEVTLDQKIIVIRKSASSRWEAIQPGVRRIVKSHLHIHY